MNKGLHKNKYNNAFTVIELMVVIAIFAIPDIDEEKYLSPKK